MKVRHSTSQNYYYKREINALLDDERTAGTIKFYDIHAWLNMENEDFLKMYYAVPDGRKKKRKLLEYYKYHNDIPRLFMLPTTDIVN